MAPPRPSAPARMMCRPHRDRRLTATDASVFHLFYPPQASDPTYVLTNQVLATYRLAPRNRSINQGAPPYANCP